MTKRTTRFESGFVLPIALIILVAMTLMGLAIVRSVDSATQVANNLGFKQSSLASADSGTELAIAWLQANTAALTANAAASGYYATEQTGTDFTGTLTSTTTDDVDWTGASGNRLACWVRDSGGTLTCGGTSGNHYRDAAGNAYAYIIQRMCDQQGTYAPGGTIQCATWTMTSGVATTGASKGAVSYGSQALPGKPMIYYRVTTRTVGPRNSVSYVQAMVLLEY